MRRQLMLFFFFNDTATTEIYTLSLHDALPIWREAAMVQWLRLEVRQIKLIRGERRGDMARDRKSTRLNSSHGYISYAVFCLKKKKRSCVRTSYRKRASAAHSACTLPCILHHST